MHSLVLVCFTTGVMCLTLIVTTQSLPSTSTLDSIKMRKMSYAGEPAEDDLPRSGGSSTLCSGSRYLTVTAHREVVVTCSVQDDLDMVIFACWSRVGVNKSTNFGTTFAVGQLNNIESNWQFNMRETYKGSLLLARNWTKVSEPLRLSFNVDSMNGSLWYGLFNATQNPLYYGRIDKVITPNYKVTKTHTIWKRAMTLQAQGYLMVANRLFLHHISLDGSRINVAVSGLNDAVAVDYDFRNNSVYWTDLTRRAIMKSTLDGGHIGTLLDNGLSQPEGLSVDWISKKIYWSDVRERAIGVLDLSTLYVKHSLISTEANVSPRGLVVDPSVRVLYWTEWNDTLARIQKASMDGRDATVLFQGSLKWPYAITIDSFSQVLYWADSYFDKVECGNVDGTGRRLVISSGVEEPFDLTLLGDILYISDWNLGILATNTSGGQPVQTIYDSFCEYEQALGVQVVAEEKQLLVSNPCELNNGHCSHLCLLSSADSRGFSCVCPDGMTINANGLSCLSLSETNSTTLSTTLGSCSLSGYTSCCSSGVCQSNTDLCYCDSDCYLYGDCCDDIENSCSQQQNSIDTHLLLSNILYIHRISISGSRIKTLHSSTSTIRAIDYNYRTSHLYWSTAERNGLWQSQLDGSGVLPLSVDDVQTVDDIAIDWITNKIYWTDSGEVDRIRVLDISSGINTTLISTGQDTIPRGIIVDPNRRWLYWSDWGTVPKIEKASMDGLNRAVIHDTDLVQPNGLTIDYTTLTLYWTDADRYTGRIESSGVDGSNRTVVSNQGIYRPFGISLYRNSLFFTDFITGVNVIDLDREGTYEGMRLDIGTCETSIGIEVFSIERQPSGANPCGVDNGGCSHLCLLSAVSIGGYSCACPDSLSLSEDGLSCLSSNLTVPDQHELPNVQGTCEAAGYTDGCCTSGTCRGSPPTCSCDSNCHVFRDCCSDVHPSCQPDVDVLEFVNLPSNITVILSDEAPSQQVQFHCSVRASRVAIFQWMYNNTNPLVNTPPTQQQLTNELGSLDIKYSVVNMDFSSTLTVYDVGFTDMGYYTCVASIGSRVSPVEAAAYLSVEVVPKMPTIVGNHSYENGQSIHLTCSVEAYPPPRIEWLFRDLTTGSIRLLLNTSITSVHPTRSAIEGGRPHTQNGVVIDSVTSVNSGDYVCAVSTNEHPALRNGVHFITVYPSSFCDRYDSLCLNGGTCENHEGISRYHCVCATTYTERNCSQRIEEHFPTVKPYFSDLKAKTIVVVLGESANLTCEPMGYPPPSIQWYRDGVLIPWETQPFLYIDEVLPRDRGNYSCKAISSEGTAESSQILLTIRGILQYSANLECNDTHHSNYSDKLLTLLSGQHSSNNHVKIYSVEHDSISNTQSLNWSDIHSLVSVHTTELLPVYNEIRDFVVSELTKVCPVNSLVRFDGCEMESVLDVGQNISIPCPCQEFLEMVPVIKDQRGWRACAGSYTHGAQLEQSSFTQCTTVAETTSSALCQAVKMVTGGFPVNAVEIVNNVTTDYKLNTTADVTLLSVVIEMLVPGVLTTPAVREDFLNIIGYFQTLDPRVLSISQAITASLTRVLKSLEQFTISVDQLSESGYKYTGQTYGVALVDISTSSDYEAQTLVVRKGKNMVNNVTEWDIELKNGTEPSTELDDIVAKMSIPKSTIRECSTATHESIGYLAYLVFYTAALFPSSSEEICTSVIFSIKSNCLNFTSELTSPVSVLYYQIADEEGYSNLNKYCASWMEGSWSKLHKAEGGDRQVVICNYSRLSYYGILNMTPDSFLLSVFIYALATCISIYCIFFVIMMTIIFLRHSVMIKNELLILPTVVTILCLQDLCYFFGSISIRNGLLCGINAGLLQFLTIALSFWISVHVCNFYSHLIMKPLRRKVSLLAMLSTWAFPVLIVIITGSIWHDDYISTHFCAVDGHPLVYGEVLPIALNFTLYLFVCILLVIKLFSRGKIKLHPTRSSHENSEVSRSDIKQVRRAAIIMVTMYSTLYTGQLFQLLSTHGHFRDHIIPLQATFATFTIVQGPLFLMYVLIWTKDGKALCITARRKITGMRNSLCHVCHQNTSTEGRGNRVIPTDTNQAYQTVMLRHKKFTMTENVVYAHFHKDTIT